MKITTEMIMAKNPCSEYTEEKVGRILGDGKTLAEILGMENIPPKDRVWATVQFLPKIENRKFAIWCARRANRNNIPKITRYIDAVEAFYVFGTLTKTEFDAYRAAYNAAYSEVVDTAATEWGAYTAAYRAAYNAAYWAEEWAADTVAYRAAVWAKDWAEEREAQIEYLKEVAERLSA